MSENKIIILIIISILTGIIIAGYYIRKNRISIFKTNGIETTARITELIQKRDRRVKTGTFIKRKYYIEVSYFTQMEKKDSISSKKIISKNEKGEYTMNLEKFKTEMGELIITTIPVTQEQFKKYKKEDKVQVLYLKDEVDKAILKEDTE